MQRKLIVSLILIAVILIVAVGVSQWLVSIRKPPPRQQVSRPPLLVNAVKVRYETVTEWFEGYGTATADRHADISAEVAGRIVELPQELRTGTSVREGQLLMRIDEKEYRLILQRVQSKLAADRAQLNQLEIELANLDRLLATSSNELESMKWEYEKVKELYDSGNAPQREYAQARRLYEQTTRIHQQLENQKALIPQRREQLQAMIRNSEAEVETARLNLDRCTITAPFDGQVSALNTEIGERVPIGKPLISLTDPRLIDIPIELPLSVRDRVRVGARCTLRYESSPDNVWEGSVHRISPTANSQMRTFDAYVLVDNSEQVHRMTPGSFVTGRVEGATLPDAMLVPRQANRRGRVFVYDPETRSARPRDIEIVRHLEDRSIISGLQQGEIVITSNLDTLTDGMSVRLDSEEAPEDLLTHTAAHLPDTSEAVSGSP